MKKSLLIIFFFLFGFVFSQYRNEPVSCKVTWNDGKQTEEQIRFKFNRVYVNDLYENSLTQKDLYFLVKGTKKYIKKTADKIASIEYTDNKGNLRFFEKPTASDVLMERVITGEKIKWYRCYTDINNDRSLNYYDMLIKDDGKKYYLESPKINKKKLKAYFSENEEVKEIIENCNFKENGYNCLKEILEKYNQ